jgi:hypothetical protein
MTNPQKGIWSLYNSRHDQSTMGIDPMNNISNNNKNTLCSYIISTLRKLLARLFDQELDPIVIYCDNQSCIKLSKNPMLHDRSKHVEIINHFIRDRIQKGPVMLQYIPTNKKVADILTKPLAKVKFEVLEKKTRIGVEFLPR